MARAKFRKNITGLVFDRLTVQSFSHVDSRRRAMWLCKCECGSDFIAAGTLLRYGHTKSCGCLFRERTELGTLRHGQSNTPAWTAWVRMRARCDRSSTQRYKNYGGRGINYCERWQVFENFLEDMGEPPPGMTLERNDVNGSYEKNNCRWATADEQYSNKTNTRWITLHGVRCSFRDLIKMSGLKYATAYARLHTYSWPVERIFPDITPESLHKRAGQGSQ